MTIFLDTANLDEIKKFNAWGIVKGLTTNQKIWLKEKGVDFQQHLKAIIATIPTYPISVELTKTNLSDEELINEAFDYAHLNWEYIVIKVPMWGDGRGLRVASRLLKNGMKVNMTCCISVNQTILACELGVQYVSFFYNRMKDYLEKTLNITEDDSLTTVKNAFIKTRNLIDSEKFPTKIIAGSIRNIEDVINAFCSGAHIVTITPEVLQKLPYHPKTEETIKEFDTCWRKFKEVTYRDQTQK